jgi:hypothetical protein
MPGIVGDSDDAFSTATGRRVANLLDLQQAAERQRKTISMNAKKTAWAAYKLPMLLICSFIFWFAPRQASPK